MVADGMAPPFEDGSFDVIVSVESAAYMPDKKWAAAGARLRVRARASAVWGDATRSGVAAKPAAAGPGTG
jgi:hypothetical protein